MARKPTKAKDAAGPLFEARTGHGIGREDSRAPMRPPARSGQLLATETGIGAVAAAQPPRKRGRPKEQDGSVVVTVRLPSELLEAVDEAVAGSGHVYRDRSEYIRQTIAQATKPGVTTERHRSSLAFVERVDLLAEEMDRFNQRLKAMADSVSVTLSPEHERRSFSVKQASPRKPE